LKKGVIKVRFEPVPVFMLRILFSSLCLRIQNAPQATVGCRKVTCRNHPADQLDSRSHLLFKVLRKCVRSRWLSEVLRHEPMPVVLIAEADGVRLAG